MRDTYWRDPLLWLLVILAVVVRVAYNLALHPEGHPPKAFVIDETEYFGAAHVLAEGRGFSFFDSALWVRPPLYVASMGTIMAILGDSYVPALVFQSLLSALTLPALGWLAFRIGGRTAARWSMALGLLYLPLILFAGLLLSETLFVFLFAWALAALVVARERTERGWDWQAWSSLAVAGLLLGLSVLTRSTALGFVPLAMLWLARGKGLTLRTRIAPGIIVLGVCLLTIAPWIVRNYAAYGRFIPVDTTGGYNLWLGSVGVRDEPRLQADLLAIPDHAERQSYAYARALETIAADPLGFAGKGLKESFDLWLPSFGAEERQVRGYALGRVPDWHLVSLFLFDDLLYILILVLAVCGLALAPPHPLKSLTGLWVLLWVIMSFVFFAVTRFRLPIVACLIPWAGAGIALMPGVGANLARLPRNVQLTSALALIAILAVGVFALTIGDTGLGIGRWQEQAPYRAAEELLKQGQATQAIEQYRRANTDLSDTRYGLAAAWLQVDRADEALAMLRSDEDPDRYEPHIIRGEAARKAGDLDDARSSFNARAVQVASEEALDWAWDHLRPAYTDRIDIGSGLDMGYVRGFYGPERDAAGKPFRWSAANSEIRGLSAIGAPTMTITIDLNGWRPVGAPAVQPRLTVEKGALSPRYPDSLLSKQDVWSNVVMEADGRGISPGSAATYPEILSITANPFVLGGDDPRLLGLRVSTVRVGAAP
jgi:4-amino-4-deoxy-L-arabinose transferase-like glycosyltransferase